MFIPNNAPPPKPPSLDPKTYWSCTHNFATPPRPPPGPLTLTARQPINPAHHLLWWSYPKLVWLSQNVPYYTKKLLRFCFWVCTWVCMTVLITLFTWNLDTYLKHRFDPENAYPLSTPFFLLLLLILQGALATLSPPFPTTRATARTEWVFEAISVACLLLMHLTAGRDGIDLRKKAYGLS